MTEEETALVSKKEYNIYIVLTNGAQVPLSIKAAETLAGEITRIIAEAKEQGYE